MKFFLFIITLLLLFFNACSKNSWSKEQTKSLALQQFQIVLAYISNYPGEKLDKKKQDNLIEVTKCLVDLYTKQYDNYQDYFNELPNNGSNNIEDKKKKKALIENLLKCNIKLSGMGYILVAQDGIEGYDINNIPKSLKKELKDALKHR